MKEKIMLDSNAYDAFLEAEKNGLSITEYLNAYEFYITKIQIAEISAIKDTKPEKYEMLKNLVEKLHPKMIPIPFNFNYIDFSFLTFVMDKSYKEVLKESKENLLDALIASASECKGCTLVTHDSKFINKAKDAQIKYYDNVNFFAPYLPANFYHEKEPKQKIGEQASGIERNL